MTFLDMLEFIFEMLYERVIEVEEPNTGLLLVIMNDWLFRVREIFVLPVPIE